MEFTTILNPAVILLGSMVWIGLFGVYGNYLEKKDKEQSSEPENQDNAP
ncbi:hypothetical protein [Sulfuricurvum sp.]|nr:hypothetical protein [Sulfuricurvum sp.]MDD2839170.1 hypothetical protein [Sulfuricurvum sp.]MDD3596492.1 hypothetical protein [Sulfuricurvum sp.]MDD4883192.1 hypothetical protein [Sulfuricurvum sp.]